MKRMLITFIISILFFATPAFADVIDPGTKNIDLYYRISNIDEYPEYIFFAHGNPSPQVEILNSSEFSFYKLSSVSIYAIKKSDFNEAQLKNMDDAQLGDFFNNNSKLIKSDIKLEGSYGNVGIDNNLDKALVELQITSINANNMTIKKSKVIYTYLDGSREAKAVTNQDVLPDPSKQNSQWYFIIPIIAVLAIGIILWRRK